jgi:hypothetical protein
MEVDAYWKHLDGCAERAKLALLALRGDQQQIRPEQASQPPSELAKRVARERDHGYWSPVPKELEQTRSHEAGQRHWVQVHDSPGMMAPEL